MNSVSKEPHYKYSGEDPSFGSEAYQERGIVFLSFSSAVG
jgi:hypothetical protein